MADLPLKDIKVLDLSRVLAGPWAAQFLADLGADVIKVERVGKGDDARHYGGPYLRDENGNETSENFFHLCCNRGKKSVTVDIARPEGQEIVRMLARQSDILVENFKVGDLERYGLDYESLHGINPKLIYCSITGFGQTGPYRKRPGYDSIFQGMSGLMSVTGNPDDAPGGGPMKTGPSMVDIITGLNGVAGIIAALYQRDVKGADGQHIDLALYDAAVAASSHYTQIYLTSGTPPLRRGTQGNGGVPAQMFKCADGSIMLTAGNDAQYARMCAAIGHPEMATDPRFTDGRTRIKHRVALSAALDAIFLTRTTTHWLDLLDRAGVPSGPINDFDDVFNDPQIIERGLKVSVDHPYNSKAALVGNPLNFSATPITGYSPPPLLGEHTDSILESLGIDGARRDELRQKGIV